MTRPEGDLHAHNESKCACTNEGARKARAMKSRSQATEKNIEGGVGQRRLVGLLSTPFRPI